MRGGAGGAERCAAAIVAKRAIGVREEAKWRMSEARPDPATAAASRWHGDAAPQVSADPHNIGKNAKHGSQPKGETRALLAKEAGVSRCVIENSMALQADLR